MLALKININQLIIVGDSMIVIQHLVTKQAPIYGPLLQIIKRIFILIKEFEDIKFLHTLRP